MSSTQGVLTNEVWVRLKECVVDVLEFKSGCHKRDRVREFFCRLSITVRKQEEIFWTSALILLRTNVVFVHRLGNIAHRCLVATANSQNSKRVQFCSCSMFTKLRVRFVVARFSLSDNEPWRDPSLVDASPHSLAIETRKSCQAKQGKEMKSLQLVFR